MTAALNTHKDLWIIRAGTDLASARQRIIERWVNEGLIANNSDDIIAIREGLHPYVVEAAASNDMGRMFTLMGHVAAGEMRGALVLRDHP